MTKIISSYSLFFILFISANEPTQNNSPAMPIMPYLTSKANKQEKHNANLCILLTHLYLLSFNFVDFAVRQRSFNILFSIYKSSQISIICFLLLICQTVTFVFKYEKYLISNFKWAKSMLLIEMSSFIL